MKGILFASALWAAGLSETERKVVAAVDAGANVLLERWVNINGLLFPLRPDSVALGLFGAWIPVDEVHRAGHLVAVREDSPGRAI